MCLKFQQCHLHHHPLVTVITISFPVLDGSSTQRSMTRVPCPFKILMFQMFWVLFHIISTCSRYVFNYILVGGAATLLKNLKVNWDAELPNIWKNKSHVPVTTNQYLFKVFQLFVPCFCQTSRGPRLRGRPSSAG